MSRYELQWAVVLNCSVLALMGGVQVVDPEGSVFWGLLIIGLMILQIVRATRPERPKKVARHETEEASPNGE